MRRIPYAVIGSVSLAFVMAGCSSTGSEPAPTATPTQAALPASVQAELQQAINDVQKQGNVPGLQAGVWTPQGMWTGTAGTIGNGSTDAPTSATRTRVGSVTKTFTVTAVMQLAERGQLSLQDPIGKYVANVPNGNTATLTNLANMTSGIPSYTNQKKFQATYFGNPQSVWTPEQLIDLVRNKKPMFAPGEKMFYSNTNTVLLGMVIEKVTGKPVAQVFQENILGPLGLSSTEFPTDSPDLPSPYWFGITEQGDPEDVVKDATNWNPSWAFTAGAMISTLDDLHKWSVALGAGQGILSAESQALRIASYTSTVPPNSPSGTYGLGVGVKYGWVGHLGEIPGYTTEISYDTKSTTSIVSMSNSDIPIGGKASADLLLVALRNVLARNGIVDATP